MTLRHPFQKLCFVQGDHCQLRVLLAASGGTICSISLNDGKLLSRWSSDGNEEQSDTDEEPNQDGQNGERPTKRRKLDSAGSASLSRQASDASEGSVEIVAERKKGERRRPKPAADVKPPNISHLLTTSDGKYVIAATVEDKSVKVFEIKPSGRLRLLHERSLPKRLCALKLTSNERTILTGDKFGDVYSIPLHPSKDYVPKAVIQRKETSFTPSATELTVHTKGNREALRQQLEQKKVKERKDGPDFEHQILIGHVSLLTDIAIADGITAGQSRPYILTADRDEHIRVSRGIPQAHIIQNYCLGHKDFISKLCIPAGMPDLLVAGNGEPSLRMFKWQTGEPTQDLPLSLSAQTKARLPLSDGDRNVDKIAVSGIWSLQNSTHGELFPFQALIVVALEGLPLLLTFVVNDAKDFEQADTLYLPSNVVDVAQIPQKAQIVVSLDYVHQSASVKDYRAESENLPSALQVYELNACSLGRQDKNGYDDGASTIWKQTDLLTNLDQVHERMDQVPRSDAETGQKAKGYERIYSTLGEFLYGLEHLRKRRDLIGEEEMGEPDVSELPETEAVA